MLLRTCVMVVALATSADGFGRLPLLSPRNAMRANGVSRAGRPASLSTLHMTSEASSATTTRTGSQKTKPLVQKLSFAYTFPKVPFEKGIEHIHSPEHISNTHKFGAPFFKLLKVLPPKLSESKASITYFCSTLFMKSMYIRMYTSRANQSNLLFFAPNGKALYGVSLIVVPKDGFMSHKLIIEINLFTPWVPKALVACMMPFFLFVNGLEDRLAFGRDPATEDNNFSEYRKMITHNLDKNMLDLSSEVYQKFRSS